MIHAVRIMHDRILRVLRVDVRVQRLAEMVETVQGVQDVEPSHVAAVGYVPVLADIGSVCFASFIFGQQEVAVSCKVVPGGVYVCGGADVFEAGRVGRYEAMSRLEV